MKKWVSFGVALATLVTFQLVRPGQASSHREAPLISQDPTADNTDLYAFVSPDRPDTVTILANYIPLEQPAGGPNFPAFDDTVLYEIHVENSGDGEEDLTYQFRFRTQTRNPDTFLYNTGPIDTLNDPDWNRPQTYSVTLITRGPGRSDRRTTLARELFTPPDNIGPRSTPDYETSLAEHAVYTLPNGIKVFAGQRDDPFFVDLGSIFDLAGLRPFNPAHLLPLPATAGRDGVARFNTHTIALQIPTAQLTRSGRPTIGVYASASRQSMRVLRGARDDDDRYDGDRDDDRRDGYHDDDRFENGRYVQVSRLGEPLINEVVIPLGRKDRWNRTEPGDDAQFASRYSSPELAGLMNLLYGSALQPVDTSNRSDLVSILLTGVPGLNYTGPVKADFLRLNTSIAPAASPSRFGVLDGDFAGFPNGRRLADDVVDIELRAVGQGYGAALNSALGLPNKSPNNLLGDGVDANDKAFKTTFPYVATPWQGYEVP